VLVEFAVVLPVLLLLIFGIIDFGRFFNYADQESQLSAQAARWAAVNFQAARDPDAAELCRRSGDGGTPDLQRRRDEGRAGVDLLPDGGGSDRRLGRQCGQGMCG